MIGLRTQVQGRCAAKQRSCVSFAVGWNRREALLASGLGTSLLANEAGPETQSVYSFTVQQYGKNVAMSQYRNEVLVIVNVASE
jgi:hypothetical protein